MARGDPDTLLAYYMFVNHGWAPGRVAELSPGEKAVSYTHLTLPTILLV